MDDLNVLTLSISLSICFRIIIARETVLFSPTPDGRLRCIEIRSHVQIPDEEVR